MPRKKNVDPDAPKRPRGRPKGSKTKPKPEVLALTALLAPQNTDAAPEIPPSAAEMRCEGCRRVRPNEEFTRYLQALAAHKASVFELEATDAEPPDRLCDPCATYGAPLENPLAALSKPEIEALAVLAAGGSMRRAARVMGVDERQIRSYLTGAEKPMIRAAYQKLLLQQGITPQRLAQVIVEALTATKYHGTGDDMVTFPDHNARLKAVAMAQKILMLEAPTELSERAPESRAPAFHFETNLGDGVQTGDGGYEITIQPTGRALLPMKRVN